MATILIVDDDEQQRVLLEALLTPAGHEVLFAPDGATALEVYQRQRVDVVLTDLSMPRFNGLRLIRALREVHGEERVVAISGVSADQLLLAEDYGAAAILRKPVMKEPLLKAVETALSLRIFGRDIRFVG